jgi:integrase
MEGKSVMEALREWRQLADVGKRPATIRYHRQLVELFQRHWPDVSQRSASVTRDDVTTFVLLVGHYSAPLFNAVVSVLRSLFGDSARHVKRRRVTVKCVTLPEQREFAAMLTELDQATRSHAPLVVRFLALSGIRLNEARQLR